MPGLTQCWEANQDLANAKQALYQPKYISRQRAHFKLSSVYYIMKLMQKQGQNMGMV